VNARQFRQALLGQPPLPAQLPDVRRQQFHRFLFGSQTSSVFCCRLLVYRILVTIVCRIGTLETSGNFGKFGLLRHLCGKTALNKHPHLKLGVIWYKVADETNGDGGHTSYLKKSAKSAKDQGAKDEDPRFRDCDADLYDALKKMVFQDKDRSIRALEGCVCCPTRSTGTTRSTASRTVVRWRVAENRQLRPHLR
jgi:hypothetical protein